MSWSWRATAAGLTLPFLMGCETLSRVPPQPPRVIPASLLAPCPAFEPPTIQTNRQLADAYLSALAWGADCRARHRGLAEAVR